MLFRKLAGKQPDLRLLFHQSKLEGHLWGLQLLSASFSPTCSEGGKSAIHTIINEPAPYMSSRAATD